MDAGALWYHSVGAGLATIGAHSLSMVERSCEDVGAAYFGGVARFADDMAGLGVRPRLGVYLSALRWRWRGAANEMPLWERTVSDRVGASLERGLS